MNLAASEIISNKRRVMLDLARRHSKPGSGSSLEFLTKRTTVTSWPNLVARLAPLQFAVVGAVATRLYMPERLTQKIDVVIKSSDSAKTKQKLLEAGFVHTGDLTIGGSTWRAPDGRLVDVVEGHESWWSDAIASAQNNRNAQGLPIVPLAYLVLMKFRAGRLQDLADISRMLGQAKEKDLAEVRTLFDREAPSERSDLESIIQLGKLEYQQVK